jgi:hypothetical protein
MHIASLAVMHCLHSCSISVNNRTVYTTDKARVQTAHHVTTYVAVTSDNVLKSSPTVTIPTEDEVDCTTRCARVFGHWGRRRRGVCTGCLDGGE